jgi:hypothetical protein
MAAKFANIQGHAIAFPPGGTLWLNAFAYLLSLSRFFLQLCMPRKAKLRESYGTPRSSNSQSAQAPHQQSADTGSLRPMFFRIESSLIRL